MIVIIDIVCEWMMWAADDHKYFDTDFISISRCVWVGIELSSCRDDGVIKIDLGHVFVSKWQTSSKAPCHAFYVTCTAYEFHNKIDIKNCLCVSRIKMIKYHILSDRKNKIIKLKRRGKMSCRISSVRILSGSQKLGNFSEIHIRFTDFRCTNICTSEGSAENKTVFGAHRCNRLLNFVLLKRKSSVVASHFTVYRTAHDM